MDIEEKSRIISSISWGRTIAKNNPLIILYPASIKDQYLSTLAYNDALRNALEEGLSPQDELLACYKMNGTWTDENEKQIKGIQDDIHQMRKGLLDYLFNTEQLEKIRSTLRRAENVLMEKYLKKMELLTESAEQFAMLSQQRTIVSRIARDENGKRLWPTKLSFDMCDDMELINHLSYIYFKESRISESTIREIARSEPWRGSWYAAKNINVSLFKGLIGSWSYNQTNLVRWSGLYDIIYDSMDRPSSRVIEDDDLTDSWLIRQSEKINDQNTKKESESLLGITNSLKDGRNETLIVTDKDGAQRIYDLNDANARHLIKQTQSVVKQRGIVKDEDLPMSRMEMRQQFLKK